MKFVRFEGHRIIAINHDLFGSKTYSNMANEYLVSSLLICNVMFTGNAGSMGAVTYEFQYQQAGAEEKSPGGPGCVELV